MKYVLACTVSFLAGIGFATLGERRVPTLSASEVKRRTEPNVVPLTPREQVTLDGWMKRTRVSAPDFSYDVRWSGVTADEAGA